MLIILKEQSYLKETKQINDLTKQDLAMQSKTTSLHQSQTWELAQFPKFKHDLACKWIYRYTITLHDGKPKYKSKLVAKGFKREQGIDFDEAFLLAVKMNTLKILLAMVAIQDLNLHQMDVKMAFLHKELHDEEV